VALVLRHFQRLGLATPDVEEAEEVVFGDDYRGGVVARMEAHGRSLQQVAVIKELYAMAVLKKFLWISIGQVHIVNQTEHPDGARLHAQTAFQTLW